MEEETISIRKICSEAASISKNLELATELGNSISEKAKSITSSIKNDSDFIYFSERINASFWNVHLDAQTIDHFVPSSQLLKNIDKLSEAIKFTIFDDYCRFSSSYKNFSSYRKHLKKYKLNELLKLYLKEKDVEKKKFIWNYLVQKEKARQYFALIKKLNKRFKKTLSFFINNLKRNLRFYYRMMLSFLFKNLDDYHSISIIQNVQFKVIQPSVLIFNNRHNETKYFK